MFGRFLMKFLVTKFLVVVLVFTCLLPVMATPAPLTKEQETQIQEALNDNKKELPVADEFRITVLENELSVTEGLDPDWMNILLLGTDTGNDSLNFGRTDTMIVLSVNRKNGKMRLSSLVRDMLVNLPYHNRQYKINAANAFGGPLLAVKTVNETFGLNIRNYVSINFSGFTKVIDSLGGVDLVLIGGEASQLGLPYIKDEPQLLNGEQALAYVRIRNLDNNFGRNERQRKLLSSLFTKMLKNSTMQQAMTAMTEALKHMDANLSINDLLTIVVPVFTNMEDMDSAGFPVTGDYHSEMMDNGIETAIAFHQQRTTEKMHAYIYQGVHPTEENIP